MKKIFPLVHGLLLVFGNGIILFVTYPGARIYFPFIDLLSLALLNLTGYLVLFLIFSLGKNFSLAALVASLFVLGLFYPWNTFSLFLGCILVGLMVLFVIRRKITLDGVHAVISLVSLVIIGGYSVKFIRDVIPTKEQMSRPVAMDVIQQNFTVTEGSIKPDIYYIVLDGYGQAQMLQDLHGYDNSGFIQELENLGFLVTGEGKSNYPRTMLSLASSLNMQYLHQMPGLEEQSELWWPLMDIIHESQVSQFYKRMDIHL